MARAKRKLHFCTKLINGIAFTSHDYKGGKYLITANGYSGERWVGYETWEKRNDGDATDRRSSFHPENKRWFQTSFKKIETPKLVELFPMPLLLPAPQSDLEFLQKYVANTLKKENDGFNEEEIEELRCETYTLKLFVILLGFCDRNNLKKHYKTLANKFHPDKGGDEKLFKELQSAYESETRFD